MSGAHCHTPSHEHSKQAGCHPPKSGWDWLLWGSLAAVALGYVGHLLLEEGSNSIFATYAHASFELMNRMAWGLALGIFFVGLLSQIPREFVMSIMGSPNKSSGIFRATLAGLFLDLCSHGILLVGMKLYERGASIGQVMAFLIASPWNSFSLTVILFSLIGLKWTLLFIVLSALIAIVSGFIFNLLVKAGTLPPNPYHFDLPDGFRFWPEAKNRLKSMKWESKLLLRMAQEGLSESRMILRWILFGVCLASLIRAFVSPEDFASYFGPTLAGMGLTLLAATLIEVCSEGSTPIAAELLTRANAPGNSFAFLMTGVSTDYTEILALKERTASWKIALFLPLITVPQVLVLGLLINAMR